VNVLLAAAADDGLHPSVVPVLVLVAVLLGLIVVLLIGMARTDSPEPGEVAIAYELAWDRFEFDVVWDLSGPTMRDGRRREPFVAAKNAAYAEHPELRGLVEHVAVGSLSVEDDRARVSTTLTLVEGGELANDLLLRRTDGAWRVEGYHLDRTQVAAAAG
jgi:hypothetical protein